MKEADCFTIYPMIPIIEKKGHILHRNLFGFLTKPEFGNKELDHFE